MKWILGLLLVGAALRFGLAYTTDDLKDDERYRYVEIARNLRAGEGFSIKGSPTAQVMPLWPLALSRLPSWVKPNYLAAALSTLAIALAFWLAHKLGGFRLALAVGALMAFDLDQARLGARILTEPLFTVLLLTFGLLWVARRLLPAALVLGLATLTRPEAFLIPLAFALFIRNFKSIAVLACGVLIALAPWAWRNWQTFHEFIPFTTTGGITAHAGMNEEEARLPFRKKGDGQAAKYPHATDMAMEGSERRWDKEYLARAVTFAREHPGEALKLTAAKLVRLWTPLQRKGTSAVFAIATLLALWALLRRVRFVVPLVGPLLLVMTFVGAAFLAIPRYRAPYHPFLFLLAGAALVRREKMEE